jgi:hypothetical protein
MLDQKRLSWLRGIDMRYVIEGVAPQHPTRESLAEITAEIARSEQEVAAARAKADQYTGGLIQSMALIEEQTHRVTLAITKQRLVMMRLGMAYPQPAGPAAVQRSPPKPPLGRSTDDKGAL